MRGKCEIWIECGEKAELINRVLEIDNERFIRSEARENFIVAYAENDIMSLLHTLDDFLSCMDLAVKLFYILSD